MLEENIDEFIYNFFIKTLFSVIQNPEVKWKVTDAFAQKLVFMLKSHIYVKIVL